MGIARVNDTELTWRGIEVVTLGDLIQTCLDIARIPEGGALGRMNVVEAAGFLAAYAERLSLLGYDNEVARSNVMYALGYVEPIETREHVIHVFGLAVKYLWPLVRSSSGE